MIHGCNDYTLHGSEIDYNWFLGWLEPLLDRIATDPTIAVAPLIPMINHATFSTQQTTAVITALGGFDIEKVSFNWATITHRLKDEHHSDAEPIK